MSGSRGDISGMPAEVRMSFGFRLCELQGGGTPLDMKRLPQLWAGVYELRESFAGDAYRTVYVVGLGRALYVLHAFMKKWKSGIGLPKRDKELIETRLKRARELDARGDKP